MACNGIELLTFKMSHPFLMQPKVLKEEGFDEVVGKRENACNQHFLFSPQCFSTF